MTNRFSTDLVENLVSEPEVPSSQIAPVEFITGGSETPFGLDPETTAGKRENHVFLCSYPGKQRQNAPVKIREIGYNLRFGKPRDSHREKASTRWLKLKEIST